MFGRAATGAIAVAAVAACSGGSAHVQPSPSSAADALSRVAATAAAATYSATYSFFEASSRQAATVQVWRSEPALRVDVVAHGTTATLIAGTDATYSCSMTGTHKSCLLVARAGEPLPAPFDVAPANLFTVYVRQLATRTRDYDVTAAVAPPATAPALPTLGGRQCFAVRPTTAATQPKVPEGTYCFYSNGVLASARYPSGNTISLQSAQTTPPPAAQFSPYAKPTPLPS